MAPIRSRLCTGCDQDKPIERFYHKSRQRSLYPDSLAGWSSRCKDCDRKARSEYVKLHPDVAKASDRAYHLSKYGLTVADYNSLFLKQNGCCAGCKRHASEFKRRLVVDHTTGTVRGLLCVSCNLCLGYVQDNPEVLNNLCSYLNSFSELADSKKSNVVEVKFPKKVG